jgi:hypothetical protein
VLASEAADAGTGCARQLAVQSASAARQVVEAAASGMASMPPSADARSTLHAINV